jgi:ubiquinone/menaquinone biosynthesis C-methylase UbiE
MHTLRRFLTLFTYTWAILSALATIAIIGWFRERNARTAFSASGAASLLVPARRHILPIEQTLERFRLAEGDTVLELGPGPGYFSIEASQMIGLTGRLLCLDLQPSMAAILRGRLRSENATAGQPVVGDATRLPLATSSVDKAFVAVMFGEIPDRPAALTELRRVLKPDGVLGFCETFADPDYMFLSELVDLCRASGFEKLEKHRQIMGYTITFAAPGE